MAQRTPLLLGLALALLGACEGDGSEHITSCVFATGAPPFQTLEIRSVRRSSKGVWCDTGSFATTDPVPDLPKGSTDDDYCRIICAKDPTLGKPRDAGSTD